MFKLQPPANEAQQAELQSQLQAICELGAAAPSREAKLDLYRELPAEAQEDAVAVILDRLTELADTAEHLNATIVQLHQMIDELSGDPWHVAMFKSWVDTADRQLARVFCGGEERLVGVSPEVDRDGLGRGATVYLSSRRNTLMSCAAAPSFSGGQLAEVCDVLDGGDLVVREHDQQARLERAHWLTARDITEGDSVVWCARSRVALDVVPKGNVPGVKKLTREIQGPPPAFAGYEDIRAGVIDAFVCGMRNPEVAARYGLSPGQGALLLYGPPGCGKTLLARNLAHELNARFFVIDASSIYSPWVGESERHLIDAFRCARESAPAVLFIDEIDAIGRARGAAAQQHADRVVSVLLTQMEGAGGGTGIAVIGACNRVDLLDPALRSRFGSQFQIPTPKSQALREVAEVHFRADLPYRTRETRGECIEVLVQRLMSPNADNQIATVRLRNGKTRTVTARDLVSGRTVRQIVEAAGNAAIRREVEHGSVGIETRDVMLAVEDTLTRWRGELCPQNVARYLPDLPDDVDVVAVDACTSVSRPARYLTLDGAA